MALKEEREVSAWPLLHKAAIRVLSPGLAAVEVLQCDREEDERFRRFAGLKRARAALWKACCGGGDLPALLILGLFPAPPISPARPPSAAVLAWGGARYLQFGFGRDELADTARAAVEGRETPLPAGLVPTAEDARRSLAEVRHWLENRLRAVEGARGSFEAALGGVALHPAHLAGVPAVSLAHQDMLDGLWSMEALGTGDLTSFRKAVGAFEVSWEMLEAHRADLRAAKDPEYPALLEQARDALRDAGEALSAAIEAARTAERGLAERAG